MPEPLPQAAADFLRALNDYLYEWYRGSDGAGLQAQGDDLVRALLELVRTPPAPPGGPAPPG